MTTHVDREHLFETVHSKGWTVVESIVNDRMGRIRTFLEDCTPEELPAWQARLDELKVFSANINKELEKIRKENVDE